MIPKIVHYCWLSDDPMPERLKACVGTWGAVLPDYEFRLWNFERFPKGKSSWVDQAFNARKYAFAADYIRAYALYNEGGIYLDSDVEMIRPFDNLLSLPYFMCSECGSGEIEAAVMGSEPGNKLFKALLDRYDGLDFIKKDGSFDTLPMPIVIGQEMENCGMTRVDVKSPADFVESESIISVFPFDYFSPINIENLEMFRTDRTYCIHHFAGSWQSPYKRFKKRIQRLVGPGITQMIIDAKRFIARRKHC